MAGWLGGSLVGWLVGWLCLIGGAGAQAQTEPVQVRWVAEEPPEGAWTVGDPVPLRLTATYSAGLEVTLPPLPQEWGPFEVLEQRSLPVVENQDGTRTAAREAEVTLWAPGQYPTPPLAVRYRDSDGEWHTVATPPLTVTVASVLKAGETEKRDLKPQASLPSPPAWPWVLGGLSLAALAGVGGWFLLARRRRPAATAPVLPVDPRPPEEIAYAELDRIAALDLPAQGELKRHYTLISGCMRNYVQGRYCIPALDRTTSELLAAFRQARLERDHVALFRELLTEADLVKFAKVRPPLQQARDAVVRARHIIDVTLPRPLHGGDSGPRPLHGGTKDTQ